MLIKNAYLYFVSLVLALILLFYEVSASETESTSTQSVELIKSGFDFPSNFYFSQNGIKKIFVIEHHTGKIMFTDLNLQNETWSVFLDIGDKIQTADWEQGLQSIVFPPNSDFTNHFYVTYTKPTKRGDDTGDLVLSKFQISEDEQTAIKSSEEILLVIELKKYVHNCGHMEFGHDGYLYLCVGDGGDGYLSQIRREFPGSILRIDVENQKKPYAIPEDNPFVNSRKFRPEIWLYGLRNPWKFSFDSKTNDMYIPDVGSAYWEELNFRSAKYKIDDIRNYGWDFFEGFFTNEKDIDLKDFSFPIYTYPHGTIGEAIIGGAVYRGSKYPDWDGVYVFSDIVSGRIWGLRGAGTEKLELTEIIKTNFNITAIGADHEGEIIFSSFTDGSLYRLRFPDINGVSWYKNEEFLLSERTEFENKIYNEKLNEPKKNTQWQYEGLLGRFYRWQKTFFSDTLDLW